MSAGFVSLGHAKANSPMPHVRLVVYCVLGACGALQLLAASDGQTYGATAIAIVCGGLSVHAMLRRSVLIRTPLSALIVLGFYCTTMGVALVVATARLMPLGTNLDDPLGTFAIAGGACLVLLASHRLYIRAGLTRLASLLSARLVRPLGVFAPPNARAVWLIGALGCVAATVSGIDRWSGAAPSLLVSLMRGFEIFLVAPFLLPALHLQHARAWLSPGRAAALGAYALLVLAIAFARNSRGVFADTALCVLLVFALLALTGHALGRVKVLAALVVLTGAYPLVTTFATAMVAARDARAELTPPALVARTITLAGDPQALAATAARRARPDPVTGYGEVHLGDPFFDRLSQTKFLDLNRSAARALGPAERARIRRAGWRDALAIMPTPMLRVLGLGLDKFAQLRSTGDIYYQLAFGTPPGGYKTGAVLADGPVLLGLAFWPVYVCLALCGFVLFDALAPPTGQGLPLVAMMFASTAFRFGAYNESLADQIGMLVRGVPQTVLTYALALGLARFLVAMLSGRAHR